MTDPKDRYRVLLAGVSIQFCAGIIYMWSVFRNPVSSHLGWDTSSASLTASFMLVAFVGGLFFGGRIMERIGPRRTCMAGCVAMSAGILLSSFVPPPYPELIYLTYGIIGGYGVGMAYTCTVSPIQRWFPDRKGFATGMMVGAFGLSLVVFAPIANRLLSEFGVPSTFRVFGLAFLIVCTAAATFIAYPPEGYAQPGRGTEGRKQYDTREMLRTRPFYLITLSLFLVLPAYFILNPMFMSLGMERGLSESAAVMGVMVTGACSASGRLAVTWISDRTGRLAALFLIAGMTAAGSLAVIFAEGVMFIACIALVAFAFGGAAGVYATVTSDVFGTKHMGSNYGYVMLGFGASALIFPFVSSRLSSGGDYTMSFVLCILTCAAAFVCIYLLRGHYAGTATA